MNKNIIIGVVVVLVLAVGALLILGREGEGIDVSVFAPDEAELNSMAIDIEAFSVNDAILDEIDDAFGDIIDAGDAFSIDTIDQEAAEADLSAALDAFAADDTVLDEIDQIFDEVSQ